MLEIKFKKRAREVGFPRWWKGREIGKK